MTRKFIVGALMLILLPTALLICGKQYSEAAINAQKYADSGEPYTFGRLIAADTLTSVDRTYANIEKIAYQIKVTSRHVSGNMESDTVYVILAESFDDSTFTNVSSTGETLTYTALGTYTIHYDFMSSARFTRLEIPRMTDSLTVNVKFMAAPREGR